MANLGVILGHVRYQDSPVPGASVVLRSITAAAGSHLNYWNHRWGDSYKMAYPRSSVPLVYTNENGNFIILYKWEPADVGIAADRLAGGNVVVTAVHPRVNVSARGTASLEIGVNWATLFSSMTTGAAFNRYMAGTTYRLPNGKAVKGTEMRLPELFTGSASITYGPRMYYALSAVLVRIS